MFLGGHFLTLVLKHGESPDNAETRVAGLDDIFDISFLRGLVRVAEQVVVFGFPECPWCQALLPVLNSYAKEVNEKWGLERGDSIAETKAKHRSTEEYRRDLINSVVNCENELATCKRKIKSFTTMINNLEAQKQTIEQSIDKLMKEQKEFLIRNIVKQLHEDYRQITEMRYFDEMSYTEIAETLNLPLGTVKARLFRSRELLLSIVKNINMNKDKI